MKKGNAARRRLVLLRGGGGGGEDTREKKIYGTKSAGKVKRKSLQDGRPVGRNFSALTRKDINRLQDCHKAKPKEPREPVDSWACLALRITS